MGYLDKGNWRRTSDNVFGNNAHEKYNLIYLKSINDSDLIQYFCWIRDKDDTNIYYFKCFSLDDVMEHFRNWIDYQVDYSKETFKNKIIKFIKGLK